MKIGLHQRTTGNTLITLFCLTALAVVAVVQSIRDHHASNPEKVTQEERTVKPLAEPFSIHTYRIEAILDVFDGDTVRAMIYQGFDNFKVVDIRIRDINTPECKGEEKAAGIPVKLVVANKLLSFDDLRTYDGPNLRDKYGRFLSSIRACQHEVCFDLAHYLLRENLAKKYGATKPTFSEEEIANIRKLAHDILLPEFKKWVEEEKCGFRKPSKVPPRSRIAISLSKQDVMVEYGLEFGYLEEAEEGKDILKITDLFLKLHRADSPVE